MTVDVIRERQHLFLGSRLKRLAEQMQGDVVLVARRAGIPIQPGQYPLLAALDAEGPQTIGDLAQGMRMSQPAITKNVDRLLEAGLIEVCRGDADRRQRVVSLSAAGQRMLERSKREVWPLVEAAVREVTEDLSGPLLAQLAEIEARLAARPLSSRATAEAPNPVAATETATPALIAATEAATPALIAATEAATPALIAATEADVPAIVALMNLAYRGRGPEAGWTTEADYIDGDRTTGAMLRQDMAANRDATMLLWRQPPDGALLGCVWLEPEGEATWYLGSLTIDPRAQDQGLGRTLLAAAERWVLARGGREIRMTVVNVRESLLAWYRRRGYAPTGATEPFPYGDDRFGTPRRDDLHFVVLGKHL